MRRSLIAAIPCALLLACASGPPPRYVVERDVGNYAYRRYQKTLDVEFVVPDNKAVGHTATYVDLDDEELRVTSAFVSVYDHARSLAAEVRERLDTLSTYDLSVEEVDGEWVWRLDGGSDRWLLWVSKNRVVKLASPQGGEVPEEVAEKYLDIYPSDLDEHGRAEEDAPSAGPSKREQQEKGEMEMPLHLRQGSE